MSFHKSSRPLSSPQWPKERLINACHAQPTPSASRSAPGQGAAPPGPRPGRPLPAAAMFQASCHLGRRQGLGAEGLPLERQPRVVQGGPQHPASTAYASQWAFPALWLRLCLKTCPLYLHTPKAQSVLRPGDCGEPDSREGHLLTRRAIPWSPAPQQHSPPAEAHHSLWHPLPAGLWFSALRDSREQKGPHPRELGPESG